MNGKMTFEALAKQIGHVFSRPEILQQALTHSSIASDRAFSNQRMEFLGDRVLGLVVANLLFSRFEKEEEGELSRRHSALVRREALARVALEIGLGRHIIIAKSEENSGGRANQNLLADACEALIGALYLDGGMRAAEDFIKRYWAPIIDEELSPPKDAKTSLQEWVQERGLPLPDYRQIDRLGLDHAPVFHVEAAIQGGLSAVGHGSSKRAAEQEAAEALLLIIRKSDD